jgi:hypothetical protein
MRAVAACLADPELDGAGTIGRLLIADHHDGVGGIDGCERCQVGIDALPLGGGSDRCRGRARVEIGGDSGPGCGLFVRQVASGDDGDRALADRGRLMAQTLCRGAVKL